MIWATRRWGAGETTTFEYDLGFVLTVLDVGEGDQGHQVGQEPGPGRFQGGLARCRLDLPAAGRSVDLDVEAGRTVALVGPTGSGKTTLVMLIPRLYDATRGAVLVDGVDVRSVDPASLRREVEVSLREVSGGDSLHVCIDGDRVSVHVDHYSPVAGSNPDGP